MLRIQTRNARESKVANDGDRKKDKLPQNTESHNSKFKCHNFANIEQSKSFSLSITVVHSLLNLRIDRNQTLIELGVVALKNLRVVCHGHKKRRNTYQSQSAISPPTHHKQ